MPYEHSLSKVGSRPWIKVQSYATVAELREVLALEEGEENDLQLARLLSLAMSSINYFCNWPEGYVGERPEVVKKVCLTQAARWARSRQFFFGQLPSPKLDSDMKKELREAGFEDVTGIRTEWELVE